MKLKIHSEDWEQAKDFLIADSFNVLYQGGRGTRIMIEGIGSFEEAVAEKEKLEAEHATFGRKACIYALAKKYAYTRAILVTPNVLYCAEELKKGNDDPELTKVRRKNKEK